MNSPEIDERIYALHATFGHSGAFTDCRECRTVIGIVDDAAELAQTSALSDPQAHYDAEPTPEEGLLDELALAVLNTPPNKEWRYMKGSGDEDAP